MTRQSVRRTRRLWFRQELPNQPQEFGQPLQTGDLHQRREGTSPRQGKATPWEIFLDNRQTVEFAQLSRTYINDLLERVSEQPYEDFWACEINRAELVDTNSLLLTGRLWEMPDKGVEFTIRCHDVAVQQLQLGGTEGSFGLYDQHPALLNLQPNHASLYFSSPPRDLGSFLSELVDELHPTNQHWIWSQARYLAIGNGMLAQGPEELIVAIQKIADNHGMVTTIAGNFTVTEFEGEPYELLIAGKCEVAARFFCICLL